MAGLKRAADQIKFRNRAERILHKLGYDGDFDWHDDGKESKDDEFYDDDVLHIRRSGLRLTVDLGYDKPASQQNAKTRAIMEALQMKRKITDRVLIEEEDEEDEEHECNCEFCTRRWE